MLATTVVLASDVVDAVLVTEITEIIGTDIVGPAGPVGGPGGPGMSAYEVAVSVGFVGTEAEWIASLGGSVGSYFHTQGVATEAWVIPHNLGYRPAIVAFNQDGEEIDGVVSHQGLLQSTITFAVAVSGTATAS